MNSEKLNQAVPLGIIDLGAHSARLEIYQQLPDGSTERLEQLEVPVRIGHDVFTKGNISSDGIEVICSIMKDFRLKLREYGVKKYRAIATSAVREALNQDIFLDRVRSVCKIRLEVLSACKESRLMYLALKNDLFDQLKLQDHDAFYLTLGTGASNIAFSRGGKLQESRMFNFGTLRLRDEAAEDEGLTYNNLSGLIDTFADSLERSLDVNNSKQPKSSKTPVFVCAGAVARIMLNIINKHRKKTSNFISNKELVDLGERLTSKNIEKYSSQSEIGPNQLESLTLSYRLIRQLCCDYNFAGIHVSGVSTRQAVLQDLLRDMLNEEDPFAEDMLSVALAIGEKYKYEDDHSSHVAALSMQIFEHTKHIHKLDNRFGLLLHIAAILHDIGRFVDQRKHHKHSYYLISNSQLPGLTDEEMAIVALTARYHRKAEPKPSHLEYMQLSSRAKVVICKLAAILRVADALDRSHQGKFVNGKIKINQDRLIFEPKDKFFDFSLESIFLKKKQGMFRDIFGLKAEIE